MAELPAGLRDAIALPQSSSRGRSPIATELGCTEEAARLRVSRGLRHLATTIRLSEG